MSRLQSLLTVSATTVYSYNRRPMRARVIAYYEAICRPVLLEDMSCTSHAVLFKLLAGILVSVRRSVSKNLWV